MKPRIIVVGQTPPPLGGQAILIQSLLQAPLNRVELFHVRMAFSQGMDEVGQFRFKKVAHLAIVIFQIIWTRIRTGAQILYYPPAGTDLNPILRDIIILGTTRCFFKRTIFHFHACGVSEFITTLPQPLRWIAQKVYHQPDCAIVQSAVNPPDGFNLKAARNVLIPCGLPDAQPLIAPTTSLRTPVNLLFVGRIGPQKGILDLIQSCSILKKSKTDFRLQLVGQFACRESEKAIKQLIFEQDLRDEIQFLGELQGEAKWRAFRNADIFCFPSYYESFGLAILEAMQFSLPVVATRWYGEPPREITNAHYYPVIDSQTGYLLELGDIHGFSTRLQELIQAPQKRQTMGKRGRELYLQRYTHEKWIESIEEVLYTAALGLNESPNTLEIFPKQS